MVIKSNLRKIWKLKNVLLHPLKEMNNVFEVVVIDLIVVLVEIDKLMI